MEKQIKLSIALNKEIEKLEKENKELKLKTFQLTAEQKIARIKVDKIKIMSTENIEWNIEKLKDLSLKMESVFYIPIKTKELNNEIKTEQELNNHLFELLENELNKRIKTRTNRKRTK